MRFKISFFIACVLGVINGVFAAQVDTIIIRSESMQKDIKCVVALPDGYQDAKQAYPTVYMLHGYSGNYANWVKQSPEFLKAVDRYGIIGVCPDGDFDSWYFDSPVDPKSKYETYISREVPAYIEAHYRTKKDRKYRALAGLSMGGHGAFYLAIKHKDFFGACVSMSGGVDFTPFPDKWNIAEKLGPYSQYPERWQQNTAQYLVGTLKNKELAISFECGTSDFFLKVNRALHHKLTNLKIEHDYAERPGGHNWDFWNNAIVYQMLFLHRFFSSTS